MPRRRRSAGEKLFVSGKADGSLLIQTPAQREEGARKVGISPEALTVAKQAIRNAVKSGELDTNGRIVLPNFRGFNLSGSDE